MPDAVGAKKTIKSEMVAARLRDFIIDNDLKPGDRLPTEAELADLYSVSRVSVREATKALTFLGILDAAPRRGLTVGNISMQRVSKYLGFHFAVGEYPVDELIETRIIIEVGGLRQLAERMDADPSIYAELDAVNRQLRGASNLEEWIEGDLRFHHSLVKQTGLNALVAFNDLVQVFFRRFREDFPQSEWGAGADSHQQIIDSLREGNSQQAQQLLTAHIASHRGRA